MYSFFVLGPFSNINRPVPRARLKGGHLGDPHAIVSPGLKRTFTTRGMRVTKDTQLNDAPAYWQGNYVGYLILTTSLFLI